MNRRLLYLLVASGVLIAALAYHYLHKRVIVALDLAVIAPLSGDDAAVGQAYQDAIQLLANEVNLAGGIDGRVVSVVVYDDQGKPETAAELAKQAAEDGAWAIIGPHSDESAAAAGDVFAEQKIVGVTPSATADTLTVNNEWFFRTCNTDSLQAEFLATYAYHILKIEEIHIIREAGPRYEGFVSAFSEAYEGAGGALNQTWDLAGGEDVAANLIIDELTLQNDETAILLALSPEKAAEIVRSIKDVNLSNALLGTNTLADPAFVEPFKGLRREELKRGFYTHDIHLTMPLLFDSANEEAHEIAIAYEEQYGRRPSIEAMFAYDAAKTVLEAIRRSNAGETETIEQTRARIQKRLAKFDDSRDAVRGPIGLTYFDGHGNAQKNASLAFYHYDNLVSAPAQLQFLGETERLQHDKRLLVEDEHLVVNDKHYAESEVVYAGVDVINVSDLDETKLECTIEFHLWFRYFGRLEATNIHFVNAVEPVELGEPIEENRRGLMSYRRYLVTGRFKPNFTHEVRYREPVIGFSFQHREASKDHLQFVVDTLGGASDPNVRRNRNLTRVNTLLESQYSWSIKDVSSFTSTDQQPILGHTVYMLQDKSRIPFSEFTYTIVLTPNTISLRGKVDPTLSGYLLVLGGVMFLLYLFEGRSRLLKRIPRAVWFVQALMAVMLLLSAESVAVAYLDRIFDTHEMDVVVRVFSALWWIVPTMLIVMAIHRFVWVPLENMTGNQVPTLIRHCVSMMLYVAASFCVLAFVFNYKITALLATSGVAAMILGLALQINLSNIVSGIALNMDRPFKIGDWIKIDNDTEGFVLNIGWRSTRIETWDECVLSIPNNLISESRIHNWSAPEDLYWLWPKVQIDPRHPPDKVRKILKDAVLAVDAVCTDPQPEIYCEIAVWSCDYTFAFAIRDYEQRYELESAVWESVWFHLQRAGIDLGTPSRELYMFQGEKETPDEGRTDELGMLRGIEAFAPFGDSELAEVLERAERLECERGLPIVSAGIEEPALYLLVEGAAWLSHHEENGEEHDDEILALQQDEDEDEQQAGERIGPGSHVGDLSLFTGASQPANVLTLTPCQVRKLLPEHIAPVIQRRPALSTEIAQALQIDEGELLAPLRNGRRAGSSGDGTKA
jgi:branched-chain amino acid transport system substrate-binding protein